MIATLIMAISVVTLLSALSTSMRNAAKLTDYGRAAQLARQKMDELLLADKLPKGQALQGPFDPAQTGGTEMGWRARLSTFEKPDGAGVKSPVLERLQLEIWWVVNGDRRTFEIEGYRRGAITPEEAGVPQ